MITKFTFLKNFTLPKQRLTLLLLMLCSFGAFAQPAGWNYSVPVTIVENTGNPLSSVQVEIEVNTQALIAANQLQNGCEDLRFASDCAGTMPVSHYVLANCNTDSTRILIEVASLAANDTMMVFMFYGNDTAGANNNLSFLDGPYSATDSVIPSSTNNVVSNSTRCFSFTPTVDLLITHFGKREPTGTDRVVTLWESVAQNIIAQDTVSNAGAGVWSYDQLDNGIFVAQGTEYIHCLFQGQGDGYYFGTSSQIGQHLTYGAMRYCNSCTPATFPTSTLNNYHYGVPDFWYYLPNIAPASVTIGQVLLADAGGAQALCLGDTLTLNGNASGGTAAYTYSWAPNNEIIDNAVATPRVYPSANATYTMTVTDANGCVFSDSAALTVRAVTLTSTTSDANCETSPNGSAAVVASGTAPYTYLWSNGDTAAQANGLIPGSYTVMVTDSFGCSSVDSITVGFTNPAPVVALGADTTICDGNDLTLDAGTQSIYSWSNGSSNQTITVNAAGSYSVTVTDANGCQNNDSILVAVSAPSVTLPADTCVLQTITQTLDAGAGFSSYLWSNGATTQTITVMVPDTGSYSVTVTDQFGCTATDDIFISLCVGIDPAQLWNVGLEVFPNPFGNEASVRFTIDEPSNLVSLRIFDVKGRLVHSGKLENLMSGEHTWKINAAEIPAGIYYLEVSNGQKRAQKEIAIIR